MYQSATRQKKKSENVVFRSIPSTVDRPVVDLTVRFLLSLSCWR